MDRKLLKVPFKLQRTPDWVCPTCSKGVLRIKDNTFFQEESSASRDHSHDAWEPDWIKYIYSCLLICTNDQCKEIVSSTGVGSVEEDYDIDHEGELQQDWIESFSPRHFEPHLKLLDIPTTCPQSVSKPLNEAFSLFFSSPAAASNCIRIAIEELLTELKVKRFNKNKGKLSFISLHRRIALLPPKYEGLKELLMAIKWLGNAGSHGSGEITIDDVLDSFEFIEHILKDIYASTAKELAARAKKVNKRKGPMKKDLRRNTRKTRKKNPLTL